MGQKESKERSTQCLWKLKQPVHVLQLQTDRKSPNHRVKEAREGSDRAELASGAIRTEVTVCSMLR